MVTPDQRVAMLMQALGASVETYKENSRILTLLDDKAQKTATLGGIFLAAALAFLRTETLTSLYRTSGGVGIVLLCAAVAILLFCIVGVGLVLWTRKLMLPPNPNELLQASVDLLARQASLTDEMRENYIRDHAGSWNRSLRKQDEVIAGKSKWLLRSQWLLFAAISMVAVLLLYVLVRILITKT